MTSELGMSGASMSRNMAATGRDNVLEGTEEQGLILSCIVGKAWQAVRINCAVSGTKRSASGHYFV